MIERDDGEWTDYEDAMEVVTILREALEKIAEFDSNEYYKGEIYWIAFEALQQAGGGE